VLAECHRSIRGR